MNTSEKKIEPLLADEPQCVQVNTWVVALIGQHRTLEPVVNPIASVTRRLHSTPQPGPGDFELHRDVLPVEHGREHYSGLTAIPFGTQAQLPTPLLRHSAPAVTSRVTSFKFGKSPEETIAIS